jgi:hypothetical protein
MGHRYSVYFSAFLLVFVTFLHPLFTLLMFFSLYLRDVIRHDYRPGQSVVVVFLSPRLSQEIIPHRMLDNNSILRGYRNSFYSRHDIPMPPNYLHLEKGPERQMRQLQFGGLGQCCNQHLSRHHNYSSSYERTSTSSAQWEKEDRNVCHVRSRELVSQSCFPSCHVFR